MASTLSAGVPDWVRAARDLYLVAIALFVVTIVIGILNGADAVEFDRNQLLTHVHAGTVGWLTLTIISATMLLFRATDRRLVLALAIAVPVYILAFYTGILAFRAIAGTALLGVIGGLLIWLWRQFLVGERSLPRLAVTLGLTSFGYGAVLGVLLQIAFAMGTTLPGDAIGAHASAMTFGYLVLVAFGVIEWRILGTRDLPRAGLVQILALFLGGLIISIALLIGAAQAGGGIYLLTQLIAVVLFVVRIWPKSLRVNWLQAAPIRHIAAATVWLVASLILFMYLVFTFIANPGADPSTFPLNILFASDHAVYLGVITNGALALLSLLVLSRAERSSWIGHLMFWGVNLGLLVFVIGLIVDTAELKRIGAPVMGVVLLVSLAILAVRAWRVTDEQLTDAAAAVSH